jgi:hypothetical protein
VLPADSLVSAALEVCFAIQRVAVVVIAVDVDIALFFAAVAVVAVPCFGDLSVLRTPLSLR